MRILTVDRVNIDLYGLNRQQLLGLRIKLEEHMDSISEQLQRANVRFHKEAIKPDAEWFRRAVAAKRVKGRYVQAVQAELSRRKDLAGVSGLAACFVAVARSRLQPVVFHEIMVDARARFAQLSEGRDQHVGSS